MFCENSVFKNFVRLRQKRLRRNLFFNKVAVFERVSKWHAITRAPSYTQYTFITGAIIILQRSAIFLLTSLHIFHSLNQTEWYKRIQMGISKHFATLLD